MGPIIKYNSCSMTFAEEFHHSLFHSAHPFG